MQNTLPELITPRTLAARWAFLKKPSSAGA